MGLIFLDSCTRSTSRSLRLTSEFKSVALSSSLALFIHVTVLELRHILFVRIHYIIGISVGELNNWILLQIDLIQRLASLVHVFPRGLHFLHHIRQALMLLTGLISWLQPIKPMILDLIGLNRI